MHFPSVAEQQQPKQKPFRELKARKAKYGFEVGVHVATIPAIAKALHDARELDANLIVDDNCNNGQHEIKFYTNDPETARMMAEQFCYQTL